jgi:hypothetical protein
MPVTSLEAIADAVMAYKSWGLGSRSWRNRNPGGLRESRWPHTRDVDGLCIFDDLPTGYTALKHDILGHVQRLTSQNLTATSTVQDLANIYNPRIGDEWLSWFAALVAHYLTEAIGRDVTACTELGTLKVE